MKHAEVHIPTAHVVEVRHAAAVARGETLFHYHYRMDSPFEQWGHFLVAHCTFFISVYISCHDEAIKENICQLRSGSKYPSQVTIMVSNDTFFFFFLLSSHYSTVTFSHSLFSSSFPFYRNSLHCRKHRGRCAN